MLSVATILIKSNLKLLRKVVIGHESQAMSSVKGAGTESWANLPSRARLEGK